MRYDGIECAVCRKAFTPDDDVVVCPVCGTPHHRECWFTENRCANHEQHEKGFEWQFPEDKDPVKLAQKASEKKRALVPEFSFKNGEGVTVCPKCGTANFENDAFCRRCREPLDPNAKKENTNENSGGYVENDPARLAYENFRLFGGLEPNILVQGIPVAELSDYIGGKTPGKMIRRFAGSERYGSKFSLNFAALIFGPLYLFYRKMYKLGALLLAAVILVSTAGTLLGLTKTNREYYGEMMSVVMEGYAGKLSQSEMSEELKTLNEKYSAMPVSGADRARMIISDILTYFRYAVSLLCGLFADKFYIKKLKKDVAAARAGNNSMDDYRRTLFKKGGVSVGGAVIGVLIAILGEFIAALPVLLLTILK